jgi:hypothetical protein
MPPPPLAGPEPLFDLEKGPLVELSLLLRALLTFFFVEPTLPAPAPDFFPLR